MKKVLALFLIFMMSFAFTFGQQSVKIDTKKDTLIVNFTAENKKQSIENNNLNVQLAKTVDSQIAVNNELTETIGLFNLTAESVLRIVEERNKTDGPNFLSNFNYSHENILKILNRQKWLVFSTIIIVLFYVIGVVVDRSITRGNTANGLITKILFYGLYGVLLFYGSIKLLTIIFNGDYYIIKELMNLYS